MIEALILLVKHACTCFSLSYDEEYLQNWARWIVEETHDTVIEKFETLPLFIQFNENSIDTTKYDELYGKDAGKIVLEGK